MSVNGIRTLLEVIALPALDCPYMWGYASSVKRTWCILLLAVALLALGCTVHGEYRITLDPEPYPWHPDPEPEP